MQTSKRFRFVDDYKVITVEGKHGRKRKKTVYIGDWIVIQDDSEAYKKKVMETRFAAAAVLVGLICAVAFNHSASRTMYVMIPMVCALFPALYLMVGLTELRTKPVPLENRQYEQGILRIKRSGMGVAVLSCITIAMFLLHLILLLQDDIKAYAFYLTDIGCVLGMSVAAACGLVAFHRMKSITTAVKKTNEI